MNNILRIVVALVVMGIMGCATTHEKRTFKDDTLVKYLTASVQANLSLVDRVDVDESKLEDVIASSNGVVIIIFYTDETMYVAYTAMLVMLHNAYPDARICAFRVNDGGIDNKSNRDMLLRYKLNILPAMLIFPNLSDEKAPTLWVKVQIDGLPSLKYFFGVVTRTIDAQINKK